MKQKLTVCGIVAVGPDNVIGINDSMPWHSKKDFYHFKRLTVGFPCVFGKNTYNSLPKKPLPNRPNIVCSSQFHNEYIDDVFYVSSLEKALECARRNKQIFICGGGQLYKYALDNDLIDVMYVTQIIDEKLSEDVKANPGAYIRFPYDIDTWFDKSKWQKESMLYRSGVLPQEVNGPKVKFYKYSRIKAR